MRVGPKVLALLTLVALAPALTLATLSSGAVRTLSGMAGEHSRAALEHEARQALLDRAAGLAGVQDAHFGHAYQRAEAVAAYIRWLYRHPGYYPPFLGGGTPLERAAAGHLVNAPGTPVGVFVPATVPMTAARWEENGLLSQVDPILAATVDNSPPVARAWVTTASGITRVYPNPGLGQAGSPVGPADDPRGWEPFQAALAAPGTVWSAPYLYPGGGGEYISATTPIRAPDGSLLAVAGVDLRVDAAVAALRAAAGEHAFLAGPDGRWLIPPPASLDVPSPAALTGAGPPGSILSLDGPEPFYLTLVRLPEAGWLLAVATPAAAFEAAAREVQAEIRATEALLLRRWGLALGFVLFGVMAAAHLATITLTRPIARLVEGTRRLGQDLSHRLPAGAGDELGDLARALNGMAGAIENSRRQAVEAARAAGEERQRAAREREVAVLDERNRLAREIHDTIAQGLTGVVIQLEAAEDALAADPGEARSRVVRARELARDSLQEARRSVWNLRPLALLAGGLPAALETLARGLEQDGFEVERRISACEPSPRAAEALYRIAQEAVANIRRHSGARRVRLTLSLTASGLELRIGDDGRGFTAGSPSTGFGLWAMRERAEALGGRLTVTSGPGQGTTVVARLLAPGGDADGPGDPGADRG